MTPADRLSAEFDQVAELRDQRQQSAQTSGLEQSLGADDPDRADACGDRAEHAAEETGPGFPRTDCRREARPTKRATREVGSGIGCPDHDQQPQQPGEAEFRHSAEPDQSQRRKTDIADAGTGPDRRTAGRPREQSGEQRTADQAKERRLRASQGDQQDGSETDHERRATSNPAALRSVALGAQLGPFPGHQSNNQRDEASEGPATPPDHGEHDRHQHQCREHAKPKRRVGLSHSMPHSAARAGGIRRSRR